MALKSDERLLRYRDMQNVVDTAKEEERMEGI